MVDFKSISAGRYELALTIESVKQQLVTSRSEDGISYIETPLLYPSGAHVVVRVDGGPKTFFVSDAAVGYDESVLIGASLIYSRIAKSLAEAAGIGFDQRAVFVVEATESQIAGAVVAVANCSQAAVSQAALRHAEKRRAHDADDLFDRLERLFVPRRAKVERAAHYTGASNTSWEFDVMVRAEDEILVCENVTTNRQSVYAAVAKFGDVKETPRAPKRLAFVRSKTEFGTLLPLLAGKASVVEQSTPNDSLLRYAGVGR